MHLGYVEYVVDSGGLGRIAALAGGLIGDRFPSDVKFPKDGIAIPEPYQRALARFDTDKNGRIDQKEFEAMPKRLQGAVLEYVRQSMP
jgi:hypothetical protein